MDFKEIINEEINEKIYKGRSNKGLKVVYVPKEGYSKQFAIFSTNYGSINNKFIPIGGEDFIELPEGIAHFLEHKLFEEEGRDISNEFSKLGASDNAFTSFTETSYIFSSTDNFYESLELLVEMVQNPYLTDENVEKEKGIITQEINMYKDDPGWNVYFNLLKNLYINHPVKMDIAGTVESINKITKEDLTTAYDTFYHPNNMILFLIGDLDYDKIIDRVNKVEKEYTKDHSIVNEKIDEPNKIVRQKSVDKMPVPTPIYYIGYKDIDVGYSGREKVKKDLVTNILLDSMFGTSSKFYNDLYNEGVIDSSFGAQYSGSRDYGHTVFVGEGDNAELVYEKIKNYLSKPVEENISIQSFERIKKKTLGRFLMGLNSIESIATSFVSLYYDDFLLFDFQELVESIEYEDIARRYEEHFDDSLSSISIIEDVD